MRGQEILSVRRSFFRNFHNFNFVVTGPPRSALEAVQIHRQVEGVRLGPDQDSPGIVQPPLHHHAP